MTRAATTQKKRLQNSLFALLFYVLIVIIWGAWVRISYSGDGCGDHWPLCNGEFIPGTGSLIPAKKTWVEYTHRLMSGGFGIFVLLIWWQARKYFAANRPLISSVNWMLALMISEALLGAKLVLFGLVMRNDSWLRTLFMGLHLINSLALVASITLAYENSRTLTWLQREKRSWSSRSLILFAILAVSGAIAALSATLFPSESLLAGLAQDFDSNSHYLLRLRIFHPLLGLTIGGGLSYTVWQSTRWARDHYFNTISRNLTVLLLAEILMGACTLLFLAPVWMKLVHLALAHCTWICLILWWKNLNWQKTPHNAE